VGLCWEGVKSTRGCARTEWNGAARAQHKYKGDGGVAFTLYGDGAANQGQLFEASRLMGLLPDMAACCLIG